MAAKTEGSEIKKAGATKATSDSKKDLETDMPLSEKDEVKKAEERINKPTKESK
jgi:hypothetical protein